MTDVAIATAARIWSHRAHAEIAAAGRFERLAGELAVVGARPGIIELAATAARDEVRHYERCAGLARHFGARTVSSSASAPPPMALGATRARDRLLVELTAMSCITESLSAALLLEIKERATEDAVRDVAQEVVRDEIAHARLGWAHLAAEAGARDVSFLAERIPRMLETTVEEEIFGDDEEDADAASALGGLGGLPRRLRREIFLATMDDVVLPGLELHGLDTHPARQWLRRDGRSIERRALQRIRRVPRGDEP